MTAKAPNLTVQLPDGAQYELHVLTPRLRRPTVLYVRHPLGHLIPFYADPVADGYALRASVGTPPQMHDALAGPLLHLPTVLDLLVGDDETVLRAQHRAVFTELERDQRPVAFTVIAGGYYGTVDELLATVRAAFTAQPAA